MLGVVDAGSVDLALAYDERRREEDARLDRQWQQQLQRLEYECDLAQRRYELVDPANRLVAQTLETAWNERLAELDAARAEDRRRQRRTPPVSTPEQMRELLGQLRQLWYASQVAVQDKKELLRCVIQQVRLTTKGKVIRAEVVWQGGARSELDVPKYMGAPTAAYHGVIELAKTHTDAEIAEQLNAEGLRTMKHKPWTGRRVMDFRVSNAIPSGLTASPTMRLAETSYITSTEAALRLGLDQSRIQTWFRWGVLTGKQDATQRQLWITWNSDVQQRLGGGAAIDGRMVSVKRLCGHQGNSAADVLTRANQHGDTVYRVRRGTSFRFYILPRAAEHRLSGQEGAVH